MGLNRKYQIQWPRSNGSYSLHLLNANIWLPSGSFNLHNSSQISQSHSNPSFPLMISWHNYFVCVTWTVGHSSRCRTIYPAAQRWHLEASSTSGSWILFRNIMLLLLYFLSPGLSLLICFIITKTPKVIFLKPSTPFHTKSEMNKPQAEGNAVTCHSQFLSTWEQERCP